MTEALQLQIIQDLSQVPASAWNALTGTDNPFLRHEFLAGLETHNCVGDTWGWYPQHLTLWNNDELVAASPLYLKTNSYGELVFDWSWADAYRRHGLEYYPKLVSAIPYTPATGERFLLKPGANADVLIPALIKAANELAEHLKASSVHWLFPNDQQLTALTNSDLLPRHDVQYHWSNQNYRNFDDFLSALTSRKRKQIRRERRQVQDASVELKILHGGEISDAQWTVFHELYQSTFDKKSGYATLSEAFFRHLGKTMSDQVVLVLAYKDDEIVAGAFNMRSDSTLYGRHWGCFEDYHSLHFEACYYAGLEYCIEHGLQRFEPGAQGEHKISRGFLPTLTHSAHWLAHEGFRDAIDRFLRQERSSIKDYRDELMSHSPYRQG